MVPPPGSLRPSLFDRLLPDGAPPTPLGGLLRDLEDLINTRSDRDIPAAYPELRQSVAGYGVPDLGAVESLTPAQQAALCRTVAEAITRWEPRLRRVTAAWVPTGPRSAAVIAIQAELSDGTGRLTLTAEHADGRFRLRAAG